MFFERHLEDNLFNLYDSLRFNTYQHSAYTHFQVFDSKKRDIHKAEVRDRLVHQIIFDYLEEIFEPLLLPILILPENRKGHIGRFRLFVIFLNYYKQKEDKFLFLNAILESILIMSTRYSIKNNKRESGGSVFLK